MKVFKLRRCVVLLLALAGLLTGCETFKGDIPLQGELPDVIYISPKNMDGIQYAVNIPVKIPEIKVLKIAGFSMIVRNESGIPVFISGQPLDDKKDSKAKPKEISIPKEIFWNGKNDASDAAAEGPYEYSVSCTDLAGNTFEYTVKDIQLDNTLYPISIRTTGKAFSPNGDGIKDTIIFMLEADTPQNIVSSQVDIIDNSGKVITVISLQKPLPGQLEFNGKKDNTVIQDGQYFARFTASYKNVSTPIVISEAFMVDTKPPKTVAGKSHKVFSPDGDGRKDENDMLHIRVSLNDTTCIKDWDVVIKDPTGETFITLDKDLFKEGTYAWDGKSLSGELVQSASDYTLEVTAEDSLGNGTVKKEIIPVDILVMKDGDRLKIIISSIYFKAYTADYLAIEPELVKKNLATLDRLAVILKKYGAYNILLEGHAVRIFWNKPKKWQADESDILLPLSKKRAEAIRDALVKRGIGKERMTTYGWGGYQPVVPHGDVKNHWKNRRVEFILKKK